MALIAAGAWAAEPVEAVVRAQARDLASRPYRPQPRDLPVSLETLGYDAYRDLRFNKAHSIWGGAGLPFQLEMFHRGGLFKDRVDLFEVADGVIRPLRYSTNLFTFGAAAPAGLSGDLGYAGFRIHSPINKPGVFDEVASFLGASYFRAVPKNGLYGLSARGLSLGSGEEGEEFPAFRAYWIERPARNAKSLVVHALLDSVSVAGAYRFVITPGEATVMEVTAELYPRRAIANAGIAPLTSMYLFGREQPRRFEDFRPQVHDSDGLLLVNSQGEQVWRPLNNPQRLQTSAFKDTRPKGFGLLQRQRSFTAYQDLEALYNLRPDLWVEPLSGFTDGDVRLVELPAATEAEDNIVAGWRPAQPLTPSQPARFSYRLHWRLKPAASDKAPAMGWGLGHALSGGTRQFAIDFVPVKGPIAGLTPDISASTGRILNPTLQENAYTGGARLSFELDPAGGRVCDLRAALTKGDSVISEIWTYRWLG